MEKTLNKLDTAINTLIVHNRNLEQQLAKLKQMILINTFVDWDSSDRSAREEFQELYNLIVKGYWIKKVYYFYSKKEAIKLFREYRKKEKAA